MTRNLDTIEILTSEAHALIEEFDLILEELMEFASDDGRPVVDVNVQGSLLAPEPDGWRDAESSFTQAVR